MRSHAVKSLDQTRFITQFELEEKKGKGKEGEEEEEEEQFSAGCTLCARRESLSSGCARKFPPRIHCNYVAASFTRRSHPPDASV